MTADEFLALNLNASSHFLTLRLKGEESPIQPVKLRDPLLESDDSTLTYIHIEGKRKRFSAIPYEFSGSISYRYKRVRLELIESIAEMPYFVRNSSTQKYDK